MNVRQVEAYRALMQTGSASRAADVLRVTQPAVSRLIAELEKNIGFPLFHRVRGRLIPTPESHRFFSDVQRTFVGLEDLKLSASKIRDSGSGVIKVASMPAAGPMVVPRAVSFFRKLHPNVTVDVQVMSAADVTAGVAAGRFDLGLAPTDDDSTGVDYEPFSTDAAVCAIPPGHWLADRAVVTPAALHGLDFIAHTPEDRLRHRIAGLMAEGGHDLNIVAESTFCTTVLAMVLHGVGVGVVNPIAVAGFVERGGTIRPFKPDISLTIFLVFRAGTQRSRSVRSMVKCLRDLPGPGWAPGPGAPALPSVSRTP